MQFLINNTSKQVCLVNNNYFKVFIHTEAEI